MKSSICVSTSIATRGGPFIFHAAPNELTSVCRHIAEIGYDGVNVLLEPSLPGLDAQLAASVAESGLTLVAVGTGAGVTRNLSLTHQDLAIRRSTISYIKDCMAIAAAAESAEPVAVVIGSLQGKIAAGVERTQALAWLATGLDELAVHGGEMNCRLLVEPLNRYETNVLNTMDDAVRLLESLQMPGVSILADLFHMNIEEPDIHSAIVKAGARISHVHLADSNRCPAGCGHIDIGYVAEALQHIGYQGYLEVEAMPWPNVDTAARESLAAIHRYFATEDAIH